MTSYQVIFTPEAKEQISELYDYIAQVSSVEVASRYTESLITYCETLDSFPHRGNRRDDIYPGLRITHYRKRAVIAFGIEGKRVIIVGIYYGGRDYQNHLSK